MCRFPVRSILYSGMCRGICLFRPRAGGTAGRSFPCFYSREQRAKWACLHAHLATTAFQSRNDGYMVMAHPEIDLDNIGHHLRGRHELAVPRFSVVRGALEEALCFFAVKEGQHRGA